MGMAIIVVTVFLPNWYGLPVQSFSWVLTTMLGLLAVGSILFRKKQENALSMGEYIAIGIILLCILSFVAWPMFLFDFNWLSYVNDDMTTFTNSALRFKEHGYSEPPSIEAMNLGTNYSLFQWYQHNSTYMARSGSDLMLAWMSSLTGLNAHQIFMPVIIAVHLVLSVTSGGLVYRSTSNFPYAMVAILAVGLSSLTVLGTMYQLLSQPGGLALVAGLMILLSNLERITGEEINWRNLTFNHLDKTVPIILLLSALLIKYPEILPFIVTAWLLWVIIIIGKNGKVALKKWSIIACIVLVGSALVLGGYYQNLVVNLMFQIDNGMSSVFDIENSLFPYFMMPSGFTALWLPINLPINNATLSDALIATGMVLILVTVLFTIKLLFKANFIASMLMVMWLLAIRLFFNNSDFGLFKLVMYMQPFLIGTIMIAILSFLTHRKALAVLLIFIMVNIPSGFYYVYASTGLKHIGFLEVPEASKLIPAMKSVQDNLSKISRESKEVRPLLLALDNLILARVLVTYTQGYPTALVDNRIVENRSIPYEQQPRYNKKQGNVYKEATLLTNEIGTPSLTSIYKQQFVYDPLRINNDFFSYGDAYLARKDVKLLIPNSILTLLNRYYLSKNDDFFKLVSANEINNYLLFIKSQYGFQYYSGHRSKTSYQQLESDYFFKGSTFASLGRYFLFEVINPTDQPRLLLDMTTTLNADDDRSLPAAVVIGEEAVKIPMMGRGAARVVSAPLVLQEIDGRYYLMIDMGKDGKHFPEKRVGLLMNLYGKEFRLDARKVIGFGRNISLISSSEYEQLQPPSHLSIFPQDLAHKDLLFSGIYEDGWLSETSFFMLTQPETSTTFSIKGGIPAIEGTSSHSELTILVDGITVANGQVPLNAPFQIKIPLTTKGGKRHIELRFSVVQKLPNGDNRPVAAKLDYIGFE
ncbi:MAG: hypothetical protein BWK78_06605 [Thiotrichaceae bacterium IS1]|nr:MAG: hypothetical protein BWK78_06605 [Thiotrichaceae bacterium IS1]